MGLRSLLLLLLTLATLCVWPSNSIANVIPDLPFEEQVRRADTVVVGSFSSEYVDQESGYTIGVFDISRVLKGDPQSPMRIALRFNIPEHSMGQPPLHAPYILCVQHGRDGLYYPVSGYHSAWPIGDAPHE
jgi:hypothetical protein